MKKEFRVKKNLEIEQIIKGKQSYVSPFFVVYALDKKEDHFRYAISVSKKIGIAVTRNRNKRRLRAILDSLPLKNFLFFVILRKNADEVVFEDLKNELYKLMKENNLLED